ncbi:MAG: HD-GYP domain-containing protein [Treponema sp.]|jgi:HD-GYP domain-containing protein (c-di-GMP phosphodiesterase class II)|nr:HD-GYP domain-containing protein [Treponema sp.]
MNKIKTKDLKPGQIFSSPVFTEDNNMLVPEMVPLKQKDIDLLNSWGMEFALSEGHLLDIDESLLKKNKQSEPEPELIRFSLSDVRQNSVPYRAYKSLIDKLNSVFSAIKSGDDVSMHAIDTITVQLLQDLKNNPDSFIGYILGGEVVGSELAKNSVNTAILSALTAQELKLPNHKINNIVSAALVHDVGMLRLSKGITEKKGGLSDAELEQIKSHPIHTSKIITKELYGPKEVNFIALHHHERWDGQGYPDGLMESAIEIGARIVSVADAFEAMVTKKSYRNSMVGYQAVKNLMADNGRRFDPAVIIAFTKIMGIYPIGSIVRLNDFSVARVVSLNTEAPLRPVVQMLMDDKGKVYGSRDVVTVDLLADKKLFIKNALDPDEYNGTHV